MEETTLATKALDSLAPDVRDMILADRDKMGGSQFPTIPLIRLANKDMKQAPEGEYFIEVRKGKDEEPEVRQIGPNPEITVLYKTNTYSYYDDESERMVAWTSDIHGFGPMDSVTLYKNTEKGVIIDFDGVYPAFKEFKKEHYTTYNKVTEKSENILTYKHVLYVLFEGKVYKMFVSNASSVGVGPDGRPSFDKPQPKSIEGVMKCWWNDRRMSYEYAITLGSRLIESTKPYYIIQVLKERELSGEELAKSAPISKDVQSAIFAMDDARKRKVLEETEHPAVSPAEAAEAFADELPVLDA